jgi:hypothetical protein
MILNEHPLSGMERLDRVERALQQVARVRKPEKVIAKLARQQGYGESYAKLSQRQKDKLAKAFWALHDKIGLYISNADRLLIKTLGEADGQ